MPDSGAAAFWSYSHEDNRLDDDNVLRLANRVQDEFALITGDNLAVFLDRDAIQWGEEWQSRIEHALAETTFFIPVITPRYFTRSECRSELLRFHGQAESLGLTELILPILYVDVPDLDPDHPDEAVALIGRLQYVNWTILRLTDASSREYREGVNRLAKRLADVSSAVSAKQLERATTQAQEGQGRTEPGLVELMQQIERLLPDWLSAVEADMVLTAQHEATDSVYVQRLERLERAGAPASARFMVLNNFARDDLPIAEKNVELARQYLAKTVELDPVVLAAVRATEQHPESLSLLTDLRAAVAEAMTAIESGREKARHQLTMTEWTRRNAHISRLIGKLGDNYRYAVKLVGEANVLVERWSKLLASLPWDQTSVQIDPAPVVANGQKPPAKK